MFFSSQGADAADETLALRQQFFERFDFNLDRLIVVGVEPLHKKSVIKFAVFLADQASIDQVFVEKGLNPSVFIGRQL